MPDDPFLPGSGASLLPAIAERRIGDALMPAVSGRDLHASLRVGRDVTNWMKDRIRRMGLSEGVDYASARLANFGEKGRGRDMNAYFRASWARISRDHGQ